MTVPQPCPRRRKPLDAGGFQGEIGSFRLHLGAEGKAVKTVRTYTDAVAWFAAAHLIPRTSRTGWEQVDGHDVQRWLVHLLARYSNAYASNQYRALQQFFRWLAEEEQIPDPMARLRAPKVTEKLVPVFTSGELSALEGTCQGRAFAERRDAAVIAVLKASGIPGRRAGRDPLPPARRQPQRPRLAAARDHRPRQGRRAPGRQDRARRGAGCGPLHPDPVKACAGVAASAVAGGE